MFVIYQGDKVFANEISLILDILEGDGYCLDEEELDLLINNVLCNNLSDEFYVDGLLNVDKIVEDPELFLDNLVQ